MAGVFAEAPQRRAHTWTAGSGGGGGGRGGRSHRALQDGPCPRQAPRNGVGYREFVKNGEVVDNKSEGYLNVENGDSIIIEGIINSGSEHYLKRTMKKFVTAFMNKYIVSSRLNSYEWMSDSFRFPTEEFVDILRRRKCRLENWEIVCR